MSNKKFYFISISIFLLGFISLIAIQVIIYNILNLDIEKNQTLQNAGISSLVIIMISFIILIVYNIFLTRLNKRKVIVNNGNFLVNILITIIIMLIFLTINFLIGSRYKDNLKDEFLKSFIFMLSPAFSEEIFFRAILLNIFLHSNKKIKYIGLIITASIFGIMHLINDLDLLYALGVSAAGLLLGSIYLNMGLIYSILLHLFWNTNLALYISDMSIVEKEPKIIIMLFLISFFVLLKKNNNSRIES